MTKTFINPEIEIIVLTQTEDILTASGEWDKDRIFDSETPDW